MKYSWKLNPTTIRNEDVTPQLYEHLSELGLENKQLKLRCANLERDFFGSIEFLRSNASEYLTLKLADGMKKKWSIKDGKRK